MALVGEMQYLTIGDNTYSIPSGGGGSTVSIDRALTSGTKSATITVDGTGYDIYAPTNTDTKLQIGAITSGTAYYPIVATDSTTAATRQYDSTGFLYNSVTGTTNTTGNATLTLGNYSPSNSTGNKQGRLRLYGSTAYMHILQGAPTAERTLTLPDATGTIALTSDINPGTVTSVQVQASGPITSSTSTAQSSTLNTTIGFSKPYVTEQNTGNGWTYRIWSNNTMEMWTTVTITAATNTSDAGGYVSASAATPQDFPFPFAAIPNVQVTCDSGGITGSVTSSARPTVSSAGSWKLYRHNTNTGTQDKNFMFYVVGTKATN